MFKTPQEMADFMKSFTPQLKTNKNGYEIRTKILEMAQNEMWQDFHAKVGAYESSIKKEGNEIVTKVTYPENHNVEAILDTANKFYDFVENSQKKSNTEA